MLAADQRITAWAQELRKAGLDGGDGRTPRRRPYLDLLLGKDSGRPPGHPRRRAARRAGGKAARGRRSGHAATVAGGGRRVPTGFATRGTLTVPLATLTGLADRPGELAGFGPVDPWLARDLARAAAHNPKTTWCVTVTDPDGHAVGHGCARPEPGSHRKHAGPRPPGTQPGSPSRPPAGTGRPAGTAPGGCAPPDRARPDHRPWNRWPPTPATTGTRPAATTPGPG